MNQERYLQEGLDLKRCFLYLKKRIWILLLSMVIGAALGAGIYLSATVIRTTPQYEAKYFFCIDYDKEYEDLQVVLDYYNSATWNDVLKSDPIIEYMLPLLPHTMDKEAIKGSVTAKMDSDIRFLTLLVRTDSAGNSELIGEAFARSLAHFAETNENNGFRAISLWRQDPTERVLTGSKVWNVAAATGVLAGCIVFFVFLIICILDDSIYVEADFEKRYAYAMLGSITRKQDEYFMKELLINLDFYCQGKKTLYLVGCDKGTDIGKTEHILSEELKKKKITHITLEALKEDPPDEKSYDKIRKGDGAVLVVRWGSRNGKRMERLMRQLEKQDCNLFGVIIEDADDRFLRQYYCYGSLRSVKLLHRS